MERLVTENEEFRNKHLEDLKNSADHSFGVNSPLSNELMNQLQERVQILADENALLVEQKIVLSTELDQQQSQAEKQFNEIGLLNARIADSQKELKDLHQKIVGLQFERDEAAKHALHCSDALGKAEQEIESLTDQITLCRQKQKETELEFNELKKQLKNMSLKHDEDGMSSLQKVKFAEDRVKELHLLLSAKTQELDATNEVLRKLRSEYQSTRQDAEGMLQVMTGMERQLNEYAAREEQVNKLASESRQKMEEAITVREQAAVREEQSRREIERLMAERKAHALQRQVSPPHHSPPMNPFPDPSPLLSSPLLARPTSRRRSSSSGRTWPTRSPTTSRSLPPSTTATPVSSVSATLPVPLSYPTNPLPSLLVEAERAARESKSTREIFERLERVHEEQHSSAQHHLQELAAQLEAVTTARETERAQKIDMQEQNKELRQIIDKYRAQTEGNKQQLSQLEKAKDQEMTGIKQTNKELSKELSDKQRQLSKLHKENEELAHQLTTLSSQQERRFQDELNVLKLRLTEMEKLNKELDTLNQTNDVRLQMLVEQLKEKYNLQVLALEAKLRGEMEKNKTLLGRARNQELLMEDLQDQKHNLTRLVEETREALRGSEEEKIHFQARIQELAMKLVESHNAREEGVYRAAR